MKEAKRVAVIGAGPCGLMAIKEFKEEGLEPVCFERTDQLGGLWRYHDDDINGVASVMKTTIINTSKEISAFSTYPPPAEYPNYMHHTLMYKYVHLMAEKFDCVRHIRYHHETVKIEKADDYEETGRWKVANRNIQTGEIVNEIFDFVAVCIGHHVYPNEPIFPGQEEFSGKIIHTRSLKKADGFEDLRVVVIGSGNSGVDAAVDLSAVASKVYLCSRRGTWLFSRVGRNGLPSDASSITRFFMFLKNFLPYSLVCFYLEKLMNERIDHKLYNLKPKHRIFNQHPTISDTLPIKLLSGTVVIRGGVKTFTKHGVIFDGEKDETEVDIVVLATGYRITFPFLSDDILKVVDNKVQLYKFIYPPELPHPTLAILGLVQPSGPGFPVGEVQCRWTARVMSGKIRLPPKEIMFSDIEKKLEFIRTHYVDSPRHTIQVDFIGYQDELAEDIGCKPNFLKFAITDPKLFWRLIFGPSLPYQYRLHGPHAWAGARDAILTYEDRTIAPLKRPGFERIRRKKTILNKGLILNLLLSVCVCLYLLFGVFSG